MANAAHELAKALYEWRVLPARTTLNKQRGIDSDAAGGWRGQVRLAHLLREIDLYLSAAATAGRDMSHYMRAYPHWARAIFAPANTWNQSVQNNQEIGDAQAIDILRALGDIMETDEPSVSLTEDRNRESLSALDDLLACLNDESVKLSRVERQYVFELISSLRRTFEESETLGSIDLLRRVHELMGVMSLLAETLAADESTQSVAKRIMKAARRVIPYVAFGGRATAGSIGMAADLAELMP